VTATILHGDALSVLATVPERSFQACVTSPPYFGLRDYGAEGQIGLEDSPDAFVERLVEVFRGVRRVLRDDGTVWLNMGDSYAGDGGAGGVMASTGLGSVARSALPRPEAADGRFARWRRDYGDAKPKDLLMIPAMLALALRRDGWWLRSDIIWAKPNPMPESVTDRPTSAHEHLFLLSKSERYFFDAEAIKEEASVPGWEDGTRVFGGVNKAGANLQHGHRTSGRLAGEAGVDADRGSRNARNVWTISTQPCGDQMCQACGRYYTGAEWRRLPKGPHQRMPSCHCGSRVGWLAHYATMPPRLAERAILAGTSAHGGCVACGAPWARVLAKQRLRDGKPLEGSWAKPEDARRLGATGTGHWRDETRVATEGWAPTCGCGPRAGLGDVPQAVLDPFGGAGTTALVARRLQRSATLIELHEGYARLARARVAADSPLLAEVS
jgi:DNA modification methylase